MQTNKFRPVEVTIDLHTSTADNPFDSKFRSSNWHLVTFSWAHNRGLISDVENTEEYIVDAANGYQAATAGLRSKLKAGTAHWVELNGDNYRLADGAESADGMLLWLHPLKDMGAKTYEARRKDAEAALNEYSDWANGAVYGYSVTCEEAEFEDSCGGFIGDDHFCGSVRLVVGELFDAWGLEFDDCEITYTGDTEWLAEYLDLYKLHPLPL